MLSALPWSRLAALKREGKATIARREEITSEYPRLKAAIAAAHRRYRLQRLKADGEVTVAKRAAMETATILMKWRAEGELAAAQSAERSKALVEGKVMPTKPAAAAPAAPPPDGFDWGITA